MQVGISAPSQHNLNVAPPQGMIRHVRCPNFEAVGLDFGPMEVYPGGIGHRFAFVGLLPNAGLDVEDIVRAFSPSAWPELQRVMVEKHGVVRLPRMNACPSLCSAVRPVIVRDTLTLVLLCWPASLLSLHSKELLGATGMGAMLGSSVGFDKVCQGASCQWCTHGVTP